MKSSSAKTTRKDDFTLTKRPSFANKFSKDPFLQNFGQRDPFLQISRIENKDLPRTKIWSKSLRTKTNQIHNG